MYSMETENDWLNFKDKDLVKIDEERDTRVFQIIKLSYDHLPVHLKKCFAFCSLFPKDYEITKRMLIRLWVAQGFVQSSIESICLEEVGDEYFMHVVRRSFFHDFERGFLFDGIYSCKMHDLIHDMAMSVSRNDCSTITEQVQHIDRRTHHLSFGFALDSSWHLPSSFLKANKLRTFLLPEHIGQLSLDVSDCKLITSSLKKLRVLDLNHVSPKMLPSCIDMLKHLRYLDLSSNSEIEVLPKSITKLYNLETLLLNDCYKLRELPSDLWKLISLRHLELDRCDNLTYMPRGIGQLSNLQTLTLFVLDKKFKHSGGPSELRGLHHLRDDLEIRGLECLRDNPSEAKKINLMAKSNLKMLTLTWDNRIVANDNDMANDNLILQYLHPHHNIKAFSIRGFGGVAISSSINPFTNLLQMEINSCKSLQSLPPLHLLLHLQSLYLRDLTCLEWIDNNNSGDNSSTFFPSLKQIVLDSLDNVKGWCRCSEEGKAKDCPHQLKDLEYLSISNCSNLISLPGHKYIGHIFLLMVNEKILQQAVYHSKVELLRVFRIEGLKSLSTVLEHLTVLRVLIISDCEELDVCNDENMQWKQLTNLRWLEFHSIPKMEYLPEGLQHVTSLERIDIRDCHNLRYIQEWTRSLQRCEVRGCPKLVLLIV